jgi:hypothetical protein
MFYPGPDFVAHVEWKGHAMRIIAFIILALMPALPVRAEVQTPDGTVREFYSWVLAHPASALPSAKQRLKLAKFLSPELVQLLKDASDTEAQCVKAAPKGEKPNLVEGDLFVGNYEGASEVAYGTLQRDGDRAVIESDLMYIDSRFPKAHKHRAVAWKDRLELQQAGTRWLVRDVAFRQGRTLAAGLKEYRADGDRSCARP